MSESTEMPSEPVIRLRPGNKQVKDLFYELEEFLKHPRAADILLGEWLHNEALPAPSPELLEFFSLDIFNGFDRYKRYLNVEADLPSAIKQYVLDLSLMSENLRWNSIVYAVARRRILELGGASIHHNYWLPTLQNLYSGEPEIPIIQAGQRRFTRFFVEAMTLQAVFRKDVPRLEALAEAVRADRDGVALSPQVSAGATQILFCKIV